MLFWLMKGLLKQRFPVSFLWLQTQKVDCVCVLLIAKCRSWSYSRVLWRNSSTAMTDYWNQKTRLTPRFFEHSTFWSRVRRTTNAPRSLRCHNRPIEGWRTAWQFLGNAVILVQSRPSLRKTCFNENIGMINLMCFRSQKGRSLHITVLQYF